MMGTEVEGGCGVESEAGNLEKFKDWECGVQDSRHKGQIEVMTTVSLS